MSMYIQYKSRESRESSEATSGGKGSPRSMGLGVTKGGKLGWGEIKPNRAATIEIRSVR